MKIYYDPRKNKTPVTNYKLLGNKVVPGENEVNENIKEDIIFKRLVDMGAIEIKDEPKKKTSSRSKTTKKAEPETKTDTKNKSTEETKSDKE